ncbi:CD80-like immunoglobulin C2-set [Trinorchestia longiramus]|nr:CD80-like immunoglobulin C2-set [Trinorchestia longiramus]
MYMLFVLVIVLLVSPGRTYELKPTTRVHRVGVAGSVVSLPCQLPQLPAAPALVLWYRGAATKPFYSFDGRIDGGSGSHKIHDASPLGRRTSFTPLYQKEPYQGIVGELSVNSLGRRDSGNYTCRVDFLHSPTMMALLTLDVHEPVENLVVVDIYENEVKEVAGPYEEQSSLYLKCRATGGYPQPDLEWIIPESGPIEGIRSPSATSSYSLSSFTSSSYTSAYSGSGTVEAVLQVAELRRGDQGRRFTCRANNSQLIEPQTQTVSLDMYYGPLAVELNGLEGALLAGKHAEVECRAGGSRPSPHITWTPQHLFQTLRPPEKSNITVSVSPDEEATLKCDVDSSSNEMKFRWAVNTTKGLIDVDPSRYTQEGFFSDLSYRPYSYQIIHDHTKDESKEQKETQNGDDENMPPPVESFGVVFCWAQNRIGWQREPCTFIVKPAGPPGDLVSCSLVNQSATSLAVSCVPGHNGGLKQTFMVTVLDELSGHLVANVSSDLPEVVVTRLAPGRDYLVEVRALNAKGTSSPFSLHGFALKVAENKIHALTPGPSNSLLMPVFAGVVAGLLSVAILLVLVTKVRRNKRRRRNELQQPGEHAPLSASSNGSLDEDDSAVTTARMSPPCVPSFSSRPRTPGTPSSIGATVLKSYVPIETSSTCENIMTSSITSVKSPSGRPPNFTGYQTLPTRAKDQSGSIPDVAVPTHTPPLTSPLESPDPRDEEGSGMNSSGNSLSRRGLRGQPLTALVDRVGSPGSIGSAASHQYYTLKINCTRRHNESFV